MTSASISSSAKPATTARAAPQGQSRAEPKPDDLRAMQTAFANARGGVPAEGHGKPLLRQPPGKQALPLGGREGKGEAREAPASAALNGRDPLSDSGRYERDQQGSGQGFAMLNQQGGFVPLPMASPPPPTVDPSAFAQMMAQLWTRENGKGAKEVRVRFGEATWPATGARLVRNAAGALDIELYMGTHGADDAALAKLRQGFADRGLALGALEVGEGEA